MLTCRQFLEALGDYLDNVLNPGVRAQIDEHVQACAKCRVMRETTRKTLELYRSFPPGRIPPDVEARLMATIEKRMTARPR